MLTSHLIIAHAVLVHGGIRPAARALFISAPTVASAFKGFEAAMAQSLINRQNGRSTLTLAAHALHPALAEAVQHIGAIMAKAHPCMAQVEQRAKMLQSRLNLNTLQVIVHVARMGSIRRFAHDSHLAQPALSAQIKQCEQILGQKMFIRQTDGVVLTAFGRALMPHLEALVLLAQRVRLPGNHRFRRQSRTLRLGSIIQTSPESWIAKALGQFVKDWTNTQPDKPISVSAMPAESLREALLTHKIDIALIDTIDGLEQFSHILIVETDLVAIVPKEVQHLSLSALLKSHPLCLTSSRTGLGQALRAMQAELGAEVELMPMVEIESLPVLVNLVAQHGFISLIGRTSAQALADRVGIVEIGRTISNHFYLVYRPNGATESLALQLSRLFK